MAHSLGLSVVAEGVETAQQQAFLIQHGCAHYQGWLFAKALPASDIAPLLAPKAHCADTA
ncbi:MAG: hypothetical protein Fur007_21480 [Rhodoferax sp.]